jgi:hypothetical protein
MQSPSQTKVEYINCSPGLRIKHQPTPEEHPPNCILRPALPVTPNDRSRDTKQNTHAPFSSHHPNSINNNVT